MSAIPSGSLAVEKLSGEFAEELHGWLGRAAFDDGFFLDEPLVSLEIGHSLQGFNIIWVWPARPEAVSVAIVLVLGVVGILFLVLAHAGVSTASSE